jgi:hypothetical protein
LSEAVTELDLSYADSLREPLLTVDPACGNGIREFNNYRAPEVRSDVNVREAAQKYDDHFLDALRYGMMHVFKLGALGHLSDILSSQDFVRTGQGADSDWGGAAANLAQVFFNPEALEF